MAAFSPYDLDDRSRREQAFQRLVDRARQSGAVVDLDYRNPEVGPAPDEFRDVVPVPPQPSEMERSMIPLRTSEGYPPPPWAYDIAGALVWLIAYCIFGLMVASFVLEALR